MSDVAAALERLHQRFLERAIADLALLRAASSATDSDLQATIHRLAGAAGTFGHHQLSELAKSAEDALIQRTADAPVRLAALVEALARLTHAPR